MSYVFSFIWRYIIYGLCSLVLYIPCRTIYIKFKKKKTSGSKEFVLAIFFFSLIGLFSQTLFPPLFRLDIEDMTLTAVLNSGNFIEFSKSGILYNKEKAIIKVINIIPFKTIFQFLFGNSDLYNGTDWVLNRIINMAGNIVLFIPLGFLFPIINNQFKKTEKLLLVGMSLSLTIEFIQFFIGRAADIDDFIVNTIGILFGFIIFQFVSRKKSPKN